jgi:hypothetical protein
MEHSEVLPLSSLVTHSLYSGCMDYGSILHEIDAELDRLMKIRAILSGLLQPAPATQDTEVATAAPAVRRKKSKPQQAPAEERTQVVVPEPQVVVLPPKQKREYRRRSRTHVPEPRALAAPRSDRPVVVQKSASPVVVRAVVPPAASSEEIEAVMRQKLLGGAA